MTSLIRVRRGYYLYFKIINTCNTAVFRVSPFWTITKFIHNMKLKSIQKFNLQNINDIEIVEAGQPQGEYAPALQCENINFYNKYKKKINNVAFYIRPLSSSSLSICNFENNDNECPICFESSLNFTNRLNIFECNHIFCYCCTGRLILISNIVCPLCRSNRRF